MNRKVRKDFSKSIMETITKKHLISYWAFDFRADF